MTTTETLDAPEALLSALERFPDATQRCLAAQPTFGLLDSENQAVWHGELDGRHVLTISGVLGTFDVDAARFEPIDPAPLEQLLVTRLAEQHAAAQPDGAARYLLGWNTATIVSEEAGRLVVRVTAVPLGDGDATEVDVTLGTQLEIIDLALPPEVVAGTEAAADADAVEADAAGQETTAGGADAGGSVAERTGITADYLGGYYDRTEFPADRRWLIVDWTSWTPDQVSDDGHVGSWVTATTNLGGEFRAYGWFDPASGLVLGSAEELVAPDLGAQLGSHYAETPFPFGDGHYVIDWGTWHAEPTPLDQPYGSYVGAAGHDGGKYQLYVRYDPGSGVEIVTAEELEAPPRTQFADAVVPELRSRWESAGRRARFGDQEYDVSGMLDGESGCELAFVSREPDGAFTATLGAVTAGSDAGRKVSLELRIASLDEVTVIREDSRS